MYKFLVCFLFVTASFTSGLAQRFQLGIETGYAFPLTDQTHNHTHEWRYSRAISSVVDQRNGVSASYGKGIPIDLNFGWVTKHGISYGVRGGYFHGLSSHYISKNIYYEHEDVWNYDHTATYFYAGPFLGLEKRISKFGIAVTLSPILASVKESRVITGMYRPDPNHERTEESLRKIEWSGNVQMGFNASLSLDYLVVKDLLAVSVSLAYTHLSVDQSKAETTTWEIDGENRMDDLSEAQRLTLYYDDVSIYYSQDPVTGLVTIEQDENEPTKSIKQGVPMDNLSLKFGLKFYINKKAKS